MEGGLIEDQTNGTTPKWGVWLLRGLVTFGLASLAFYFSWWREADRITSPALALGLALVALYQLSQILGGWLLYLFAIKRTAPPNSALPPSVDVFVPACGESFELVHRCLRAAVAMRGDHSTYLLDDSSDPALAQLAQRLGAGYLTRPSNTDAKAGNINAALPRTNGEIVVIFDTDHIPSSDFLERTMGCFSDPEIGFVQVMLSFSNATDSWVARAATETSFDFHNPTSMGMDGLGSVTLQGSNALIRRSALVGIGGYQAGLAEDLATSIQLHAAGWRSAFIAEPLAPGLAPLNLEGWFTQQLKWARGVFEVLLTSYPTKLRELTWGQRLSYTVRSTYYWIGPLMFVHLLVLTYALTTGGPVAQVSLLQYLLHCGPLVVAFFLVRKLALGLWRHPSTPTTLGWRGMLLLYGTWPIYTLAWVMALLRRPLEFRSTPKGRMDSLNPRWLMPHVVWMLLLGMTLFSAVSSQSTGALPALVASAFQTVLLIAFCLLAGPSGLRTQSRRREATPPLVPQLAVVPVNQVASDHASVTVRDDRDVCRTEHTA
jgi:cellulose synthase (UDP-forming)